MFVSDESLRAMKASVAVDYLGFGAAFGQIGAFVAVALENLDVVVFRAYEADEPDGYARAPHYHYVMDSPARFSAEVDEFVDIVARRCEIENVVGHQAVVAARYDGLVFPAYGRDVEVMAGGGEFLELHSGYAGVVAQLDADNDYLAVVELEPVAHPVALEGGAYFQRGQIFGIDRVVYARAGEEGAVGRIHELVVVDAGHCFMGAEAFGYLAGDYIVGLVGGDGYKQLGFLDSGGAQG